MHWQMGRKIAMLYKIYIGPYKIVFTIAKVTWATGVNSRLEDGKHILKRGNSGFLPHKSPPFSSVASRDMWDFDDLDLDTILAELSRISEKYNLPDIYILETKKDTNYIAYCFQRCDWHKAISIVADTEHIDPNFLKYGVYRGTFTLRVSSKCSRTPKLIATIEGQAPPDAAIKDLGYWYNYETLADGQQQKLHIVKIQ